MALPWCDPADLCRIIMLTKEDKEAITRSCFEWWGLSDPDIVELYHAYRIIQIREERTVMLFDDFQKAWKDAGG